jgi:hypothetical protein
LSKAIKMLAVAYLIGRNSSQLIKAQAIVRRHVLEPYMGRKTQTEEEADRWAVERPVDYTHAAKVFPLYQT